jgi:hypothetical protein
MARQTTLDHGRSSLPIRMIQIIVWLVIAAAFAHLYLDVDASGRVRTLLVGAAVAAVLLSALVGAVDSPATTIISGTAAAATCLLAVGLWRLHLAHETGVLLFIGGAVNAAIATARLRVRGRPSIGS